MAYRGAPPQTDPIRSARFILLTSPGFHHTHRAEKAFEIDGAWGDSIHFAVNRPDPRQLSPKPLTDTLCQIVG